MSTIGRRGGAAVLATTVAGLLWVGASPTASAHVTVAADKPVAGGYAVLTFAFSHGCEGSSTTELTIGVPESIDTARPQLKPDWQIDLKTAPLDGAGSGHDGKTERVEQVVFTADTPVPDGYRETVQLQVQLPEDSAGQTLAFPTVQTCETGETAWIQVPAEGQNHDDLDAPAPTITVAEGDGAASGHGAGGGSHDAEATTAVTGGGGFGWGLAGFVAGLAGLAAGVTALVRSSARGS